MASTLFLKNKLFTELFINVDTAVGMAENMFYYSNFPTKYTSTKSLMKYPRKGLPPFFFMNEDPYMPLDKRFILPDWGSRETKTIQQNGFSFTITKNANEGFIASTMSLGDGSLREEVLLVGVSTQRVTTQVCYILGNFEEVSVAFYSDSTSWLLDSPLIILENPERNNEGLIELEYELKFKCFVLTIKSLKIGERMPRVNLLRFSSVYELTGEEIQNFSFTQEVKGEGFATGLALKTCEFSFTDAQGIFDKQNPSSPFYGIDLRNFIMTPRVDYFLDGTFEELEASYPLGEFYGDPLEESGNDYTAKMKGTTLLGKVKDIKTNRHYYTLTNLKEVLEDLFLDVGVTVYVEEALRKEVFLYQFYGGDKLESVLKPLLEKYRLVARESINSQITIITLDNSSLYEPKGFYNLSNTFKYQAGAIDKVVNKLTVKYVQNTLSDEGLERYWTRALLPTFTTQGEIRRKVVNIEMDNTTKEIEVLEMTQNLLELPKLVNLEETKDKIYSARNPNVPQPEPTLNYHVLLEETFNPRNETYISEIILSKNNSTDSQPSYLEFEWWAEDCFYKGSPATLVTVDVWVYVESAYEYVKFERTYGDNLKYNEEGYAYIETLEEYRAGEEGQSLFYGEAQIIPPLDQRGKLLKTENIELKSNRGRVKEINDESKERADIIEIEASAGQVWDRIESDLYRPAGSEKWLWVEETFLQDKIKIRYLNLSASPKSYEIRIYGREFVKKDHGQDIYENIESQIVYGEKEGESENLDLEKVEQYLKFHAKPWETVSLDVHGTPSIMVGDLVQFVSEYNVLGRGQITKNVFKIDKGNVMSSTLTTLKLPTNEINPLGDFSMGVVGDMSLG